MGPRLRNWLTGAPGGADEMALAHIRAEQSHALTHSTPLMMVLSVCAACVLLASMLQQSQEQWAIGWTFMVCVYSAYCYVLTLDARKRRRHAHVTRRAIFNAVMRAFVLGALWAALPVGYVFSDLNTGELVVFCLTCLMMGAGAFFLSPVPGAAYAFVAPMVAGAIASVLAIEGADHVALVALFLVYGIALARVAHLYAARLVERLQGEIDAERASGRDPATGLPNRESFAQELGVAFQRLERFGEKFAVASISFERLGEEVGTSADDVLVAALANHLVDLVDQTDFVGCTSEREFSIILAGVHCAQEAAGAVERLVKALALPSAARGEEFELFWAAGVALASKDGESVDALMRAVASALKAGQADADHPVRFFDSLDESVVSERRQLEADLRQAVENGELRLEFQPILDVKTNRIASCETLVRWVHPTRGLVTPDVFIPIAERTGLIHEIGEWIMRESCRVLALLPSDVHMAMNVSAAQLRGQSVFETLREALADSGVDNRRIDIEVTESLLIARDDPALTVISALADQGYSITLDDFGTGYASLNYLNRMPLTRVKIDRQFVAAMATDPRQAAIVAAILGLSKSLGLEVTAEGVETHEQVALLRAVGCDCVQGYLVSRPLPERELLALFAGGARSMAAA